MMQLSKWIEHTVDGMPVHFEKNVEVETDSGVFKGIAWQFGWNKGTGIKRYRVELTEDEVAEEEEWARLAAMHKLG